MIYFFIFFNDTATTYIYTYCHTLSLHDALPISGQRRQQRTRAQPPVGKRVRNFTGRGCRARGMGRGARDKRPYPRRQDGQAAVAPRALVSGIDRAPVEEDRRAGWDGALSRSRVGFGVGSCRFILPAAKP